MPNGLKSCVTDKRVPGEGVSELRIDYGPGYRVYFVERGQMVVILLAGGDKRTQAHDRRVQWQRPERGSGMPCNI